MSGEGTTHFYGDGCDPPHEMPAAPPGDQLTVIVRLPAPLASVARLLKVVGEEWPLARVITDHPEGWRIEIDPGRPHPLDSDCPHCGAPAGEPCRTASQPEGRREYGYWHASRGRVSDG